MKILKQNIPAICFNTLVYILMCTVALLIYILQKSNIALPSLIGNYVNDFLCLPIVLGGILFVIRMLKKDDSFRFPLLFFIFMATYYSFYFEYYLPQHNPRYTSDWIDIVLYFSGALTFFFYEKRLNPKLAKTPEKVKHKLH